MVIRTGVRSVSMDAGATALRATRAAGVCESHGLQAQAGYSSHA